MGRGCPRPRPLTRGGVAQAAPLAVAFASATSQNARRRAELSDGNATGKLALERAAPADLSFSEPLMNSTSSTLGPGLKSRKNSRWLRRASNVRVDAAELAQFFATPVNANQVRRS